MRRLRGSIHSFRARIPASAARAFVAREEDEHAEGGATQLVLDALQRDPELG